MTRTIETVPEVPHRDNQRAHKPQRIDEPKPTAIEVFTVNHRTDTVAGRQVAKVGLQESERLKQAKVLYVISKTDKLFDLTSCVSHAHDMRAAGVDVTYVEMPSDKGHMASHADAAMWAPILAAFLKGL